MIDVRNGNVIGNLIDFYDEKLIMKDVNCFA